MPIFNVPNGTDYKWWQPHFLLAKNEKMLILADRISIMDTYY